MAGILRYGVYVPYHRLAREQLPGGGRGQRSVAGHDEDSTTLAVEAARQAADGAPAPDTLLLATTSGAYAEKSNAATLHAACGLPDAAQSVQLGTTSRAGLDALILAARLAAPGRPVLCVAADVVLGAPGSAREREGGDGAVALLVGVDEGAGALLRGAATRTAELVDTWRLPDQPFASQWEERFGTRVLAQLLADVSRSAIQSAGLQMGDIDRVVLDAESGRTVAAAAAALQLKPEQRAPSTRRSTGRCGVAQAGIELAQALDDAAPGERILAATAADGAAAVVLEVTEAIGSARPPRSVASWIARARDDLAYTTYLRWREVLRFEPPRRPDPARPAPPATRRSEGWKLRFVGSVCTRCGAASLPPQRVCAACHSVDCFEERGFADRVARVRTFSIDHLAHSPAPPTVSAVLDFEGGGRLLCDLTDLDPSEVRVGMEVEMSFRRLFVSGGIVNYFWRGRPRQR